MILRKTDILLGSSELFYGQILLRKYLKTNLLLFLLSTNRYLPHPLFRLLTIRPEIILIGLENLIYRCGLVKCR